ncbi:RHS repeat-associated core domain-containing protein [Chitinophaga sp. YR573]|uniref:DUF6443 domain-containing protein n=1 Tax=Chitinophaga sp. YR573 TaxID=1881040 RepID=UPI0008D2AD3C|nr:DUF6443 domain-containing protein [Chitinophaga sp. YR573]SEV91097.1 RHS repeat-associated core domain-containing protein [Chitinophaga sp. YR573]
MNKITAYITFALLWLGISSTVKAQNVPNGQGRPAAVPVALPGAYTDTTINLIRTWEPSMPATDTNVVSSSSRTLAEVKESTQYFDGLGRPLQTINRRVSPLGRDLVTPFVYDAYGREQFQYLPYVPKTGNTSDGKLKIDPWSGQRAFYRDSTLIPGIGADSVYYDQTDFEPSPLNRVLKSYSPGNSWAKTGGNHPSQLQYLFNKVSDSVRIWYFTAGNVVPVSGSGKVYAPGQLHKNVSIDNAGMQTIEYKDKENQLVLKKKQLSATPGTAHVGWLCTYYCYNDLGQFCFVVPPKATDAIKNNWVITSAVTSDLCFIYRHDELNRVIVKKEPGADSTENVYDVRDRVAFSRDGALKVKGQWLFHFYDDLNRPTMTALCYMTTNRADLQSVMNTATSNTMSIPFTFAGTGDLIVIAPTGDSLYEATNSITFQGDFDSGTGANFIAQINPNATNGADTINATNPHPYIVPSGLIPVSYTFYDDYNYAGKFDYVSGDAGKPLALSNPYAETNPSTPTTNTKGMLTGMKVRILDTDQWLTTTQYYNDKGRNIQSIAQNTSGGETVTTSLYNFNGKVLSTYERIRNFRSIVTPQITLLTMMHYDAAGRMDSLKKQLNDDPNLLKTIAVYSYDELGKPKLKRLAPTSTTAQLESLNYERNVRGWLKSINKNFVNTPGSSANYFGEELSYDYGFDSVAYNGNIAGAKWKSISDGTARAYGYSYDKTSRITAAYFSQQNTGSTAWTKDKVDFSVSNLSYDANGNIKTMTQKGMIGNSIATIDQLTYTYPATSNKLSSVSDPSSTASSKLGDFLDGANTGDDYSYDENGNLNQDLNKGVSLIAYNYLNLPQSIKITGKGMVTYTYDAAGNKLRKTTVDSTQTPVKTTTTDYISGLIYEQDSLQVIPHEDGRIRVVYRTNQAPNYGFDYFDVDHLGNVRVVLATKSDTAYYAATMESAASAYENALFSNIDNTRTAISGITGYPTDNTTNPNAFVAKLNATSGQKIGPSLVLRVMAGDTVQINATGVYISTAANTSVTTPPDMISAILNAFSGSGISDGVHGAFGVGSAINTGLTTTVFNSLKQIDTTQNLSTKPKAYLNFALFDDQFALVNENSGVRQIQGSTNVLQPLSVGRMTIKKTGFLYIYTNNESGSDVFFDNLVVTHNSGPVIEETHYYPFGLTMAGISNHALKGLNYPENRLKYNGKELQSGEFADGSGIEWYDYGARMQDPQLGRWHVPDPLAGKYDAYSPYNYAINNPVSLLDPNGMDVHYFDGGVTYDGADAVEAFQKIETARANFNDGGKRRGKNKTAFVPALYYLLAGEILTGATASTSLYHFPSSDDWKAAWNDFYAKLQYIPNGGVVGYELDQLFGKGSKHLVGYDPALALKMFQELARIYSKTSSKSGVVYALLATHDGLYNVYVSGSPVPSPVKVLLKAGDVWKYGETTDPKNRYDDAYLQQEGVRIVPLFSGNQVQLKAMEKFLIYGYYFQTGQLPPANKMFR